MKFSRPRNGCTPAYTLQRFRPRGKNRTDQAPSLFLHQAVLSAVICARTRTAEPRWIPISHAYPPDPKHISTSYVERQNLTMRMSMRRFTRPNQRLLEEG